MSHSRILARLELLDCNNMNDAKLRKINELPLPTNAGEGLRCLSCNDRFLCLTADSRKWYVIRRRKNPKSRIKPLIIFGNGWEDEYQFTNEASALYAESSMNQQFGHEGYHYTAEYCLICEAKSYARARRTRRRI
jgi:hypothetical protein